MLAAIVAAVIVPFGFALSTDHDVVTVARATAPMTDVVASAAPVVATGTFVAFPHFSEGMKLFAIGTALIALASAMRRTG